MKLPFKHQQGQIIAIFIVVVMVLFVFAALALDGGLIYVDRRNDQSAADAAALAGVGNAAIYFRSHTNCQAAIPDAVNAAIARAADNNFTGMQTYTSEPGTGAHGVWGECRTISDETYLYVHTYITTQVSTNFAHLFYNGPIKNSVTAVSRVSMPTNSAYAAAITSLNDSCHSNDGMTFSGSAALVTVYGGGIHSNSCLTANGGVTVRSCADDGCTVPEDITVVGDLHLSNNSDIWPEPTPTSETYPTYNYGPLETQCAALEDRGSYTAPGGNPTPIQPGRYSSIRVNNNKTLNMSPGLYCMTGNFRGEGGTINANGVTIFMMGSSSVTINGSVSANMSAACSTAWDGTERHCRYDLGEIAVQDINPASIRPVAGFLFMMANGNIGSITLNGTSSSDFVGTIYAPDGDISISGTSDSGPTYSTQLVGNNVSVSGNPVIDIRNFPRGDFLMTSSIDQLQ